MQEIIIHGWDELQSAIFSGVWDPDILRYRDNCVYRGMADWTWGLTPSLNRIGEAAGKEWGVNYLHADFKKKNGYLRSLQLSKEYGLYRQDYCGCLYSKPEKA